MGSTYKKAIGIGVSIILIPLGKWALGKIVERVGHKFSSDSGSEEDYYLSADEDTEQYGERMNP